MIKNLQIVLLAILLSACATKKKLLYFQDANTNIPSKITYISNIIQPNDILDINIGALVPETAIPYNFQTPSNNGQSPNIETLKLRGYLVSIKGTISLPILGEILVVDKTTSELQIELVNRLEKGKHLISPSVKVRLLNSKVTILGEVKNPGTFQISEQSINLPQALGYAGDLTINGKRKDVLLIREDRGKRLVFHVDLTTTNWMNDEKYRIKPNDIIVVNPNQTKVKSSGYIGNASVLLSLVSVLLSTSILLNR